MYENLTLKTTSIQLVSVIILPGLSVSFEILAGHENLCDLHKYI